MQALTFLLFINWSKKYVIFLLRLIEHIQALFLIIYALMTILLLNKSYFSQTYRIWYSKFVEALAFISKYANLINVSAIIFL